MIKPTGEEYIDFFMQTVMPVVNKNERNYVANRSKIHNPPPPPPHHRYFHHKYSKALDLKAKDLKLIIIGKLSKYQWKHE